MTASNDTQRAVTDREQTSRSDTPDSDATTAQDEPVQPSAASPTQTDPQGAPQAAPTATPSAASMLSRQAPPQAATADPVPPVAASAVPQAGPQVVAQVVPGAVPPAAARRGLLAPVCAALALAAAVVALAAPTLRPLAIEQSNAWFGQANPIATWLTEDDAVARELAALAPRLASLEREVQSLRAGLRGVDQRLGEAASQMHEGLGSIDTIARQVQEASQRADLAQAASEALGARVRAATMIAIGTRLRRNVDAGAPIADDVALLGANAPYPAAVGAAVATLDNYKGGVRTMRDLATGFEAVDAAIVAATGLDSGWQTRPWLRLRSLFGGGPEQMMASEAALLERIRAFANQGRFAEAAVMLGTSPWRAQAEEWMLQVTARTAVVQAVQAISGYALSLAQAIPASAQRASQRTQ